MSITAQETSLRGDTNLDGVVDINDVTELIDYLMLGEWPETSTPQTQTYTVNGVSFTMVIVEGGSFWMGGGGYGQSPLHKVTLTGYSIGETEVTQELWQAVMGNNPSRFSSRNGYEENLQRPVEYVTWDKCQEFINKLNEMTGQSFRLPTEAEWEFAACGGNKSEGYQYAGSNKVSDVAWYNKNAFNVGQDSLDYGTHTVATKAPNELGLYDMSGNVWEWCQDWYDTYTSEAQTNPTGPDSGTSRVVRSGGWTDLDEYCCASSRSKHSPTYYLGDNLGLRLAM